MVTAIIGQRFLKQYNQQFGVDLTAKQFFETVFVPLFYDHPRYMMVGGNTALSNPPFPKGTLPTAEQRGKRIAQLVDNIDAGYLDTRTTLDFPAAAEKEFAVSSGQVTDLALPFNVDTAYYSWIGAGFGVGVAGGQVILFDHPTILDLLYEGWQLYRQYLDSPAYGDLAGNQINSWNGRWLAHRLSRDYRPDDPTQNFQPFERAADKSLRVSTQTWLGVLLGIARALPNPQLTGYLYKLGSTNSTYGFIPFELPQIKRPADLYRKLFGDETYEQHASRIVELYGSARSFQAVLQRGTIGVEALEPKGLRDIIPTGRGEAKNFKYDPTDETSQITFNTYITWLLAMLNNDEFWDEARRAAHLFLRYEQGAGKLKADRGNHIDKLRNAPGKRSFLEAFVTVMENGGSELLPELEAFAEKIHKLPNDNFPYFQTLIKLRYARQSREAGATSKTPDLFANN